MLSLLINTIVQVSLKKQIIFKSKQQNYACVRVVQGSLIASVTINNPNDIEKRNHFKSLFTNKTELH